jgi:heme oxygenase
MIAGRPLRALKDHTYDLHLEAERYVHILERSATVGDYARYLSAMLGFHAPIEDMLGRDAALDAAGFAAAERRKQPLIERDLSALPCAFASPCPSATPRCAELPAADTLAGQLGIAYVIEGSTLGGKFILARLPPALAALRGTATAFLEGYGPATGARWKRFGAIVERHVASPGAEACAIAAARETFSRLIDWLGRFEQPLAKAS